MMTLGLMTNEKESLTKQFTMLITLRCTLTQSVLLGFRCGDTSGSTRNYLKAIGMTTSLKHSGQMCPVHKQTINSDRFATSHM